jgi:hypothetical protein
MLGDRVYVYLHMIRNLHLFVLVRSFVLNDWMTCWQVEGEVETAI